MKGGEEVIADWVGLVLKRILQRGSVDTIKWIKLVRLCYTRYLSGDPFKSSPDPCVSIRSDGLPRCGKIVTLMGSDDVSVIRLVLTLLLVSRILPGHKVPDLSSIITSGKSINYDLFRKEISVVMKDRGWNFSPPVWEECHLSTKAGPNSQAMIGSLTDLQLLTPSMLKAISTLTKGAVNSLIDRLQQLNLQAWNDHFKVTPKILSKLSVIKDKEAKSRIIAICDYWTQTSLRPLSLEIFSLFKRMKNDCTFDQGKFRSCLPSKGPYFSYDLSSATDRFPVEFQEIVVANLVSCEEYASAWRSLISDREFSVPWEDGLVVKYKCGQPMGAYSSWAVFSLSHHVVVAIAAKRAGFRFFSDYALLGDDIVIANSAVALEYRQILDTLGVSISESKSHVSDETFEFAKRWIHKGVEVTGAPLSLLMNSDKPKWFDVTQFIRDVEERWLPRSYTLASRGLFAKIFRLMGVSQGLSLRLARKSMIFHNFPLRDDTPKRLTEKSLFLLEHFFKGDFGCNRVPTMRKAMWVWLGFAKVKVVTRAIKKSVKSHYDLVKQVLAIPNLFPEELDSQSILMDIVPVSISQSNLKDLTLTFDKMKSFLGTGREKSISLDPSSYRLGLDPSSILSTRSSRLEVYANVTTLYYSGIIADAILEDRRIAACPDSDDNQNPWKKFQEAMQ